MNIILYNLFSRYDEVYYVNDEQQLNVTKVGGIDAEFMIFRQREEDRYRLYKSMKDSVVEN